VSSNASSNPSSNPLAAPVAVGANHGRIGRPAAGVFIPPKFLFFAILIIPIISVYFLLFLLPTSNRNAIVIIEGKMAQANDILDDAILFLEGVPSNDTQGEFFNELKNLLPVFDFLKSKNRTEIMIDSSKFPDLKSMHGKTFANTTATRMITQSIVQKLRQLNMVSFNGFASTMIDIGKSLNEDINPVNLSSISEIIESKSPSDSKGKIKENIIEEKIPARSYSERLRVLYYLSKKVYMQNPKDVRGLIESTNLFIIYSKYAEYLNRLHTEPDNRSRRLKLNELYEAMKLCFSNLSEETKELLTHFLQSKDLSDAPSHLGGKRRTRRYRRQAIKRTKFIRTQKRKNRFKFRKTRRR